MVSAPIDSLRVHFYGVQGSGSVFPDRDERQTVLDQMDAELLQQVFAYLQSQTGSDGLLHTSVEALIGGPVNTKNLRLFRDKLPPSSARIYGGWTTCVRVETADGYDIVLDCGSGFRNCARAIVAKWAELPERHLYILGSHSHYDHTEGFDQAPICFDPRNHIHVYGNHEFLQALDQNLGIFSHHIESHLKGLQTPLSFELMPAHFHSYEIRNLDQSPPTASQDPLVHQHHPLGQPIHIGQTQIQPFEVFHPSPCLAYRFEHRGKVFVYCTDHELRHGEDPEHPRQIASLEAEARLRQHSYNAHLLYRDGQFLRVEYDGHLGVGTPQGVSRLDWGHSCIEDVIEMATQCQVRQTFIGHHDPNRFWLERNWFDETLRRQRDESGRDIQLAQAEIVVDL